MRGISAGLCLWRLLRWYNLQSIIYNTINLHFFFYYLLIYNYLLHLRLETSQNSSTVCKQTPLILCPHKIIQSIGYQNTQVNTPYLRIHLKSCQQSVDERRLRQKIFLTARTLMTSQNALWIQIEPGYCKNIDGVYILTFFGFESILV